MAWLEAHPAIFTLGATGPGSRAFLGIKATGELARLVAILLRRDDLPDGVHSRLRQLLQRAWRSFGEGRRFAELLEARPDLPIVASLYAPFHRSGLVHEPTLALLAASGPRPVPHPACGRERDPAAPVERVAFAGDAPAVIALALADARRALGLGPAPAIGPLLARTLLGQCASGPADRAFVSSVAHAAFFASDFGARPHEVAPELRAHLRNHAPSWIEGCRRACDLDAAAELALALACVAEQRAAGDFEAALCSAQRPDGSLPGRPPREYHATITGVLASFALTVGLARA